MESVERSAKTVEEAIELALKELGAQRDEVEVVVISKGKAGILGLGSEPARVRATRLPQAPLDQARLAREVMEHLLATLGVDARIELQSTKVQESVRDGPILLFQIEGSDAGLLIGRRGETLSALQYLVTLILSHQLKNKVFLELDVERYRERRQDALKNLALRMADRAVESGRAIALEPMPSAERRLVHVALANHPKVTTHSTGDGDQRKVVIVPKRPDSRANSPQRRPYRNAATRLSPPP
jgi:spoIIIJ-associated protein